MNIRHMFSQRWYLNQSHFPSDIYCLPLFFLIIIVIIIFLFFSFLFLPSFFFSFLFLLSFVPLIDASSLAPFQPLLPPCMQKRSNYKWIIQRTGDMAMHASTLSLFIRITCNSAEDIHLRIPSFSFITTLRRYNELSNFYWLLEEVIRWFLC